MVDKIAYPRKKDRGLITAFKTKFIDYLRKYYYIGGMPEAVVEYAGSRDYDAVRKIHEQILFTYEQDFSKHAPHNIVPRIRNIWLLDVKITDILQEVY